MPLDFLLLYHYNLHAYLNLYSFCVGYLENTDNMDTDNADTDT